MRRLPLMPALLLVAGLSAQAPVKSLNELKAFYVASCARCHGPDGSGRTPKGKKLCAPDFTDATVMARKSDERMVKAIRKGIFFGVVMPPFKKRVSEVEAQVMVSELLRKAEKGKDITPAR
ncbi:cytochrome c [Geothrix sp. PMB-07]|uniref:c-type cytochrome n=1 Tax=Geothrix sp. PMB-07 TaxID=3068640 RepID=UPI002741488B|nr:cytochrome c [Geothrix sp. PMB-07]WLT30482.1 cytochrome c [Geothrix sp. PMB-07]